MMTTANTWTMAEPLYRPARKAPATLPALSPVTVCSWCQATLVDGDPAHGITHGVCEPCADAVLRVNAGR
jgi:hypothetical protein